MLLYVFDFNDNVIWHPLLFFIEVMNANHICHNDCPDLSFQVPHRILKIQPKASQKVIRNDGENKNVNEKYDKTPFSIDEEDYLIDCNKDEKKVKTPFFDIP